ncbi:MAG: class I SAM-dependent methyltransferase [bacterium]
MLMTLNPYPHGLIAQLLKKGSFHLQGPVGEKVMDKVRHMKMQQRIEDEHRLHILEKYKQGKELCLDDKKRIFHQDYFKEAYRAALAIKEFNKELVHFYITQRYSSKIALLDVGCGLGYFLEACQKECVGELYGVDISPFAVNLATKKGGFHMTEVDIETERLPFESASFDCVWCKNVLEYLRDPAYAFHEIHRVLKSNGELILSTINGESMAQWINNHYGDPALFQNEIFELKTRRDIDHLLIPEFKIETTQSIHGLLQELITSQWIKDTLQQILFSLNQGLLLGITLVVIARKVDHQDDEQP